MQAALALHIFWGKYLRLRAVAPPDDEATAAAHLFILGMASAFGGNLAA
jgi:hypothetical protein